MKDSGFFKCPGSDPSAWAKPEIFLCPDCKSEVDIWTDEKKGRCPFCKTIFERPIKMADKPYHDALLKKALELGASFVGMIPVREIVVDDHLAHLCEHHQCSNYGLSAGCPPYVSGSDGFRRLMGAYQEALVINIELPMEIMLSHQRREIFRLLHDIVSSVEQNAVNMGYSNARGFASGGCKQLFCFDYPECRAITKKGDCRNPDLARPSMSGYGIDVVKLLQRAGCASEYARDEKDNKTSGGMACGFVMIC